ncbi:MAG: hypothetical protein U0457_08235 [Candidatus Sericytochromatia bacterium]
MISSVNIKEKSLIFDLYQVGKDKKDILTLFNINEKDFFSILYEMLPEENNKNKCSEKEKSLIFDLYQVGKDKKDILTLFNISEKDFFGILLEKVFPSSITKSEDNIQIKEEIKDNLSIDTSKYIINDDYVDELIKKDDFFDVKQKSKRGRPKKIETNELELNEIAEKKELKKSSFLENLEQIEKENEKTKKKSQVIKFDEEIAKKEIEIVDLYQDTEDKVLVLEKFNISEVEFNNILEKHNFKPLQKKIFNEQEMQKIKDLLIAGFDIDYIKDYFSDDKLSVTKLDIIDIIKKNEHNWGVNLLVLKPVEKLEEISEDNIKEVVDLYKNSIEIKEIEDRVGLNASNIVKILKKSNIEIHLHNKIRPEDKDDMIKDFTNGKTYNEIADKYSVSRSAVRYFFLSLGTKRLKVSERENVIKVEERHTEEIIKLYQEGHGLQKIGRVFNISNATVEKILRNNNIPLHKAIEKNVIISDEEKEKILKMYEEGTGIIGIYKELGISMPKIRKVLNENKVLITRLLHNYKMDINIAKQILDLFNDGVSNEEIIEKTGVSEERLKEFLEVNDLIEKEEDYNPPSLTEEQRKEIEILYKDGKDSKYISKKVNASYFVVYKYVKFIAKKHQHDIVDEPVKEIKEKTKKEKNKKENKDDGYEMVGYETKHIVLPTVSEEEYSKEYTDLEDALENYYKVKILTLNDKNLTAIPTAVFSLPLLEKLTINGATIKEIPADIGKLENLRELNLSSNIIDFISANIAKLKNLEILDLSENRIYELQAEIKHLSNLVKLNLSYNKLKAVPQTLLRLTKLKELNISNNEIGRLPMDLDGLVSLENLLAKNNQLGTVPPKIGNIETLRVLDLEGNQIRVLPDDLARLKNVRLFNLRYNPIKKVQPILEDFVAEILEIYLDDDLEERLGLLSNDKLV